MWIGEPEQRGVAPFLGAQAAAQQQAAAEMRQKIGKQRFVVVVERRDAARANGRQKAGLLIRPQKNAAKPVIEALGMQILLIELGLHQIPVANHLAAQEYPPLLIKSRILQPGVPAGVAVFVKCGEPRVRRRDDHARTRARDEVMARQTTAAARNCRRNPTTTFDHSFSLTAAS